MFARGWKLGADGKLKPSKVMEETMYATTIGKGPFKPAIVIHGVMYVQNIEYEVELAAFRQAYTIYERARDRALTCLRDNSFNRRD